jgi:hypothetical protein
MHNPFFYFVENFLEWDTYVECQGEEKVIREFCSEWNSFTCHQSEYLPRLVRDEIDKILWNDASGLCAAEITLDPIRDSYGYQFRELGLTAREWLLKIRGFFPDDVPHYGDQR